MKHGRAINTGLVAGALCLSTAASALVIESPKQGERVLPGQAVQIIIKPSSAEEQQLRAVSVLTTGAQGCEKVEVRMPIRCTLTVPDGSDQTPVPPLLDIRVRATFANGRQREVFAFVDVAPPSPLMGLRGDPGQSPLIFRFEGQQKYLTVFGEYADGSVRDLRSPLKGTQYESSDPAVVDIRDDGLVTAGKAGAATISVRNGSFAFEVPVVVRTREAKAR